jgi:hypothetical protein
MIQSFSIAIERMPVRVLHAAREPIRGDGGAEGLMLVAQRV